MQKRKNQGFTLIELSVTLAFMSILLGIALHSFITAYPRIHLNRASRDLVSNFQRARMEALKRNLFCTVTFNQAVNGETYSYVVYADADDDLEYDVGEEILAEIKFSDYGSGVSFDNTKGGGDGLTFASNDEGCSSIAFNSRGLPINNSGGFGAGSVFLKNEKNYQKAVVVSLAGRIRID